MTLERPLYLLTLEEKVGREKEQLTSLLISPQGGVALNSAEESWLSWDLPVATVLTKGLRMVEMTEDTGLEGCSGFCSWGPAVHPHRVKRCPVHRISGWKGKERDVEASLKIRCANQVSAAPRIQRIFLVLHTGSWPCRPRLH